MPDDGFLTSTMSNFPVRSSASARLGTQNDLSLSAGFSQTFAGGDSFSSG
jgi:hypothetical protein